MSDGATTRPLRNRGVVLGITAVCILLDALAKQWAVASLESGTPRDVLGGLVRFDLSHNPGMAFSQFRSGGVLLSFVALAAIVGVTWYAGRATSALVVAGLGFIAGGAAGNLVDRLFREPGFLKGYVVDFVRLPNWPTFNLADTFLFVGVACVFAGVLIGERRERRDRAEQPDG